jgi:uncharacterized protein (TIGR02757 family)
VLKRKDQELKEKLDSYYLKFGKSMISPDPLEFIHMLKTDEDIEAAAFIASVFAYGNVRQINSSLTKIFGILGLSPYNYLVNSSNGRVEKDFKGINHRFYSSADVISLIIALGKILKKHGSLKQSCIRYFNSKEGIKGLINGLSGGVLGEFTVITPGVKFMFPLPEKGSACKRMNLFLRWMVRKDELDFGIWSEIPASCLIIPVDTHIARIAKQLKLTSRKNVSWNMAEEITGNLRKFDPDDPVKYDFALCHIGIRKLDF